jgi:hypothetical protein
LGVAHPVVTGPLLKAEQKLVTGAGRPLHLTAALTDPQQPSQAGTTLTATGQVEFSRQLAEWTSALPAWYGGRTTVIYAGGDVYVRAADMQTKRHGSGWLLFTPADMANLSRLGVVANLVVQWDPFVAVALQASARASRAAHPTATTTGFGGRRPGRYVLVDDGAIPGCPADDSDSSDYSSTLTPDQVADDSGSDFEEFLGVMQVWSSVALTAEVDDGSVYEIALTSHLADAATQIAGGITFCSAVGAIKTLAKPSDAQTEAQSFFTLDPCVVGTWELETQVVEGIRAGAGPGGTLSGLQGSAMTIDEKGAVTFDFSVGKPMTIDENFQDSEVLASAEFDIITNGEAELDKAAMGTNAGGEHSGTVLWATTADVLDSVVGILATTAGVQYTSADPDVPSPPGVGPTFIDGNYTCNATTLTMPIPVGAEDEARFTRDSALDTAEFEEAIDDFKEALQKLEKLTDFGDLNNEVDEASLALDGAEPALGAVDVLAGQSCKQIAVTGLKIKAIAAVINKADDKLSDVSTKLSAIEDKVTDQAGEVDDALTTASVAAVKALEDSHNLSQEAAGAIRAATTSVTQEKALLNTLVQQAKSADSDLSTDTTSLATAAKLASCPAPQS